MVLCARLLPFPPARFFGLTLAVGLLVVSTAARPSEVAWGEPASEFWPASRDLLDVAVLAQRGEVANCGPTAAAMILRHGGVSVDPAGLRDRIGHWSWDRFPMRALSVPGRAPGMTSPGMMRAVLDAFGGVMRFRTLTHPFIPGEAYALVALREALASGRPVLLMVESPVLWGTEQAGLHWIVVRGVEGDQFIYNDPSDGSQQSVSAERLWRAWRLHPLWRRLPGIDAFTAFVADRQRPCDHQPVQLAAACPPWALSDSWASSGR